MLNAIKNTFITLLLLTTCLSFGVAYAAENAKPKEATAESERSKAVDKNAAAGRAECNINGGGPQCCSARNCTGVVLNRPIHVHNCEGRSWTAGQGICNNRNL